MANDAFGRVSVRSVLVVDDHRDAREILVRVLHLLGYAAAGVDSGQSALDAIRAAIPALVILDVMMPHMTGFDVLTALRDDERFRHVPVVMHSALDDEVTRAIAIREGAQAYFVKTELGLARLRELAEKYLGDRDVNRPDV